MAYQTGFTATASGLLTNLTSFIVSDCGWNLHDDISTSQKVFYSDGSDLTQNIYIRLQTGLKDRNLEPKTAYWQNQEFPNSHYQHINVFASQYWNNGTHVGTNELTGKISPWFIWMYPETNTTNNTVIYYGPHRDTNTLPGAWTNSGVVLTNPYSTGPVHDGYSRYAYLTQGDTQFIRRFDLLNIINTNIISGTVQGYRFTMAVADNGDPCLYGIKILGGATANIFLRIRLSNLAQTFMANPPAGGSLEYTQASLTWDGKDYIYSQRSSTTNLFYRYQISTNTWTTLANLPVTGNGAQQNNFCYLPSGSNVGIANSWTSDRIYYRPNLIGDTTIRYYDVNANTWSTAGGTALAWEQPAGLTWNGLNHLYYYKPQATNGRYRVYNITSATWSTIDVIPAVDTNGASFITQGGIECIDAYHNQITVDTAGTTYWMFGDKDRITVVTKDATNLYRYYYFGIIDSYYSTQKVITTGNVSAGSTVNIPVSGFYDQFQVGQPLYIYDPRSGGTAQRFSFSASGVNTITAASLASTYNSGSIIGVDPQPVVMYCNGWDSVFPVHSTEGPALWGATNNPHATNVLNNLIPTSPMTFENTLPGRRGHMQLWPIQVGIYGNITGRNTPSNSVDLFTLWNSQQAMREVRGQLIGTYVIDSATAPNPVQEDEIQIGSDRYMVFKCDNFLDAAYWNASIAVGPK